MGFSYSAYGLCCDFCGHSHETRKYVRKISCPYGFCQAWACCDTCRAEKKHMASSCTPEKKTHKEYCLPQSIQYDVDALNKDGINCKVSALKCGNCKAPVIRIESGTKFSHTCIYEKCKQHRSLEEIKALYAKVLEAAA